MLFAWKKNNTACLAIAAVSLISAVPPAHAQQTPLPKTSISAAFGALIYQSAFGVENTAGFEVAVGFAGNPRRTIPRPEYQDHRRNRSHFSRNTAVKKILFPAWFLWTALYAAAQTPVKWTPYLQQNGVYFSSDHVTSTGAGMGLGLAVGVGNHFLAQSDVNIYWINGNAVSTRLAAGYKRSGNWAPAILGNLSVLWGGRTEVLLEDGKDRFHPWR